MADPVTLAGLGAVALTEGIKFLYGQASELLKTRRERQQAETVTVEVPTWAPLDRRSAELTANLDMLDENHNTIDELASALARYAQGWDDIDPDDQVTIERIDRLRSVLEVVYGMRLTFAGESREPTGTRVSAGLTAGRVSGELTGVDAETIAGGAAVQVDLSVTEVVVGGKVTGVKAPRIG